MTTKMTETTGYIKTTTVAVDMDLNGTAVAVAINLIEVEATGNEATIMVAATIIEAEEVEEVEEDVTSVANSLTKLSIVTSRNRERDERLEVGNSNKTVTPIKKTTLNPSLPCHRYVFCLGKSTIGGPILEHLHIYLHMTHLRHIFDEYNDLPNPIEVEGIGGSKVNAIGKE